MLLPASELLTLAVSDGVREEEDVPPAAAAAAAAARARSRSRSRRRWSRSRTRSVSGERPATSGSCAASDVCARSCEPNSQKG